jgi:hypothetical protein
MWILIVTAIALFIYGWSDEDDDLGELANKCDENMYKQSHKKTQQQ